MIFISHRGNIQGCKPELENNPHYIMKSIDSGYFCEVDVRVLNNNELYLGHDYTQYKYSDINKRYLPRVYHHCKDLQTLLYMKQAYNSLIYFYHEDDPYTLVSNQDIWAHPNSLDVKDTICLLLNTLSCKATNPKEAKGFCFDNIDKVLNLFLV